MKKVLKSVLAAVLWLLAVSANAHQPDISSFTLIEHESGQWMLQLNASMTAFQYEVRNAYGEDSYASPEAFNQLLVNHLKKQIAIQVNGEEVTLRNGLVKLGHATTVAFELSEVPEAVTEVFVQNRGFENIHDSKVIFSIVKEGVERKQFVLNEENNFHLSVSLKEHRVLLAETLPNDYWIVIPVMVMIAGLLGLLFFKKRRRRKTIILPISHTIVRR